MSLEKQDCAFNYLNYLLRKTEAVVKAEVVKVTVAVVKAEVKVTVAVVKAAVKVTVAVVKVAEERKKEKLEKLGARHKWTHSNMQQHPPKVILGTWVPASNMLSAIVCLRHSHIN